jgi:UDP-N-acetylmuramyl pentapeptide phosphotransferase/UDP-N-acetylglucosamine-1-phosphate transferase
VTLAERLLVGFALAAAVAYVATPYAIGLANRLQFYDRPAGYKGHLRPTPYLGGAAVMAGFVVAALAVDGDWQKTAPLLLGAGLLWLIGTIDDRWTVSPALRVLAELALGVLVWRAGLRWSLHAGDALDLALTCLWILAVVNAFNLFDNMDGAAATMALVVSAGAALIGVLRGEVWLAAAAASLCGACLGFLPRNLSKPSRIFLGDGGSMPVGFAVAVLVMAAAETTTVAWRSLLVSLLLVAVPALDTSLVIVSRRRRGVSVLTGGRDHLTHRTRRMLSSPRAVVLALGVVQAATSVLAVLASEGDSSLLVISVSLYVLVAGAVIIVLDTQQIEEFPVQRGGRLSLSKRALACLIVLGLGAGLSPFFFVYYDPREWAPIGLGITLVCAIAVVLRPVRIAAPAVLSLAGLLGLGIWSLTSSAWAESVQSAVVGGNRWLVYGALFLLMLALVSHERRGAVLLGAATAGVSAVAVSVLVRMLGSDPGALFLDGRLNSPLGYINGEGCLFAMGVWPWLAAAEARRAIVAGPAAAMAALMACLALLSQSRGTALAMAAALILVMALTPGRVRRAYALLVIAGGVALAAPDLLHVYEAAAGEAVGVGAGHDGARAALLAMLLVGCVWALLVWGWRRVGSGLGGALALARAGSWLLALAVVAALALAIGFSHRIDTEASRQWHAFVHVGEAGESTAPSSPSTNRSRLLSGAGNRYDYWRIAWQAWTRHPLDGLGAGNYPRTYFERRSTTEDVEQPHSLELQTLSELGLVGALLLGAFVAGIGWGALRMRRVASRTPLVRALMVGGLGAFTAWLVQASVDWMQLLPGLTGIALAAAVLLVWPRAQPGTAPHAGGRARFGRALAGRRTLALGASAVVVALIVSGASLSRQGLSDLFRSRAQKELDTNQSAAIADADRSLEIDGDAVQTYYVKAAALARFDQARAAESALTMALAREPQNYVTWALLGDVAARQGRLRTAKGFYAHAHRLNPLNRPLSKLALNPREDLH